MKRIIIEEDIKLLRKNKIDYIEVYEGIESRQAVCFYDFIQVVDKINEIIRTLNKMNGHK